MIYILFGLPGAGKTYVGNVLKKYFNFYVYEGDKELPIDMKRVLKSRGDITDKMRDEFFYRLSTKIQELQKKHSKLVITQTYIKEKYRKRLLNEVPLAKFIFIETKTEIREKRLQKRKEFPIDLEYARKMSELFDPPKISHSIITNSEEGEESVKKQIEYILYNPNVIASDPD